MRKIKVLVIQLHSDPARRTLRSDWIDIAQPFAEVDGMATVTRDSPFPLGRHWWRIDTLTEQGRLRSYKIYQVTRYRFPRVDFLDYFFGTYVMMRVFDAIVDKWGKPDILHSHVYYNGFRAALLSKRYGIPLVHSEPSPTFSGLHPDNRMSWLGKLMARYLLLNADIVLPRSEWLRRQMESHGFNGNFRVLPAPINTEIFHPKPRIQLARTETVHLICVARLAPVKGIPVLLRAFSLLGGDNLHLNIVGDGPKRQEYETLASELGISNRVTFYGRVRRTDIAPMLRACHVFVLASQVDSLPRALLEAVCSGLPVVATEVGGIPEVVTGDVGRLVPPQDPQALATALQQVIGNLDSFSPEEIAAYGQGQFGYDSVGSELRRIYLEVLDKRLHKQRLDQR